MTGRPDRPDFSGWLARPETMRLAVEALARAVIDQTDGEREEGRHLALQGVILALLAPRAVPGDCNE